MATDNPVNPDDDLASFVAAGLANAAHPIVEGWQAFKRGERSGPNYLPSAAQFDALERALADLYSVLPGNEGT